MSHILIIDILSNLPGQCVKTKRPGPKVIKLFSCSTQLRLNFILLINVKMSTNVGILTFMSRINYRLWWSKHEISIYLGYFSVNEQFNFYAQLS